MWLNRLPAEYRRRYYTNLAAIVAFLVFIGIVGRLGKHEASLAILGFIGFLLIFMAVWPLVRLLQCRPRPKRTAFIFYATWIFAYGYVGATFFVPGLPGWPIAALIGMLMMCAFFIVYRGILFPGLFDGGFHARWQMVREAQRADRAARESFMASLRDIDGCSDERLG